VSVRWSKWRLSRGGCRWRWCGGLERRGGEEAGMVRLVYGCGEDGGDGGCWWPSGRGWRG
ncbi:hypothetical protein Tco_0549712, partial [Tanacetum coccineum]